VYRGPSGYSYRRWHYGDRLPRAYYARNFWLTNFVIYGLFAPPPGLIWVRYGPDALLIDQYTGEIVQVRYNVFYY
jgi:Ni/Co efflux regulator RcnB